MPNFFKFYDEIVRHDIVSMPQQLILIKHTPRFISARFNANINS